ncbi:SLC5/6 family protein [Rickettsia rickettsii]|uniref:hypothetical protein n=1 Tax=Rickettsia rickettsii TaxID=783 RepID=UPI000045E708|nr:hypothetical protein [Rickettsia rickettsii]USD84917.1 hypothetical protein NDY50_04065 [Rickettsia rickettsii]USD86246.1 hypothetical protein NDY48_04040 [Rickettsia rickettsii]USD87561.1 hypothetical protein NDY49_04085 [Rickettsia rickettsii]WGQ94976.1 hypothetical protein QBX69_04105 [Rickettsia rickettsii str. 'Sheila Smith']
MPNIDLLIFTSFLAINLLVGLLNITNIKNICEYAIGTRNFSTGTIVATLIATWISTSTFLIDNSRIYTDGLLYLLPSIFGSVILLLSQDPVVNTNELFLRIIKSYIGFKGLIVGVIMAMIIASTNSYINVAVVTFTNDIIKKASLNYNYITAITIGLIGFIISLYTKDLINLFLLLTSIYLPLITLPLILLIYGFKSSAKSFFIVMITAILTIILWQIFSLRAVLGIYPILSATIVNLLFFLGSHYILKQPGGFSSLKEPLTVKIIRQERERKGLTLFRDLKNFNIFKYWESTLPNQEITYSYVGIFILISMFSSLYITSGSRIMNHLEIYNIIYHTTLITAAILITYPLWSLKFQKNYIISLSWFVATFVILIFFGSLLVISS